MAKYSVYDFVVADREMVAKGGGYTFRTYTDRAGVFGNPGAEVLYNDGTRDKQGRTVGKAFSVNQSHYKLIARDGQKDVEGLPLFDFFSNAPFCLGSPNGDYTDQDGNDVPFSDLKNREEVLKKLKTGELTQHNVKIKLLDNELDAQIALEAGMKRSEAQMSAGQIDDETLTEIAALLVGEFGKPDKMMRYKVYEAAGKRPIDYFTILNAGDRPIRALIRKALADRILVQKGPMIYWNDTIIGNDEDSTVAKLNGDSEMLQALKDKVGLKAVDKTKPKGKK